MGVSLLTVLEIAGNPKDIKVSAERDKKTGKWAGFITRGPGHNYKLLISTEASYPKKKAAIADMKRIVGVCKKEAEKQLEGKNNPFAALPEEEKTAIKEIVHAAKNPR